jgi:hypothetical protein
MILLIEKYLLFIVTDQIDSPAGTVEPYLYILYNCWQEQNSDLKETKGKLCSDKIDNLIEKNNYQ